MIEMYPRCPHNVRNTIRDLHTSEAREQLRIFLSDGPRASSEFLESGAAAQTVILRDDASELSKNIAQAFEERGAVVYGCGAKDMQRMSTTESANDILCVFPYYEEQPLGARVVLLDGVSDPGNVGTIIRSAAWFGATDIVLSAGCADAYNPKVVRSTAGCLGRLNVRRKKDLMQELDSITDVQIPIIAAVAHGGQPVTSLADLTAYALVIGSEAHGVSRPVLDRATTQITIPGGNGVESLNAAVAASILLYALCP